MISLLRTFVISLFAFVLPGAFIFKFGFGPPSMATCIGTVITGIVFMFLGARSYLQMDRYAFENMSDGGVVRYKSYWRMQLLHLKWALTQFLGGLGLALILVGGLAAYVHSEESFQQAGASAERALEGAGEATLRKLGAKVPNHHSAQHKDGGKLDQGSNLGPAD